MSDQIAVQDQIAQTVGLLREKLGVRGKTLEAAVRKARHRLPRRVHKQAMKLAQAEDRAAHPRLRLTLNTPALSKAAREVRTHLESIDLADRRKGWWLGMLGGLAFNLLLLLVLLLVFWGWRYGF